MQPHVVVCLTVLNPIFPVNMGFYLTFYMVTINLTVFSPYAQRYFILN